jgi:hypothetical protein
MDTSWEPIYSWDDYSPDFTAPLPAKPYTLIRYRYRDEILHSEILEGIGYHMLETGLSIQILQDDRLIFVLNTESIEFCNLREVVK